MKSKIVLNVEGGLCADLIAWEMDLEEWLGRAYRAVVTAASEKRRMPDELREHALGRRAVVTVEQFFENGLVLRYLDGIVTGVAHEGPAQMRPEWLASFGSECPKGSLYSFVIEPALSALKFARRTCDYPDTTPLKVVRTVLARHGIVPVVDAAYVSPEKYSGNVRFVQDDETDWNFLHRVLSRYGLSYAFAHDANGPERMYLSDGRDYPSASALGFENLTGYSDVATLPFSCVRQERGSFPMARFVAASHTGVDYVRSRFVRPAESVFLEKERGDPKGARQWLLSEAPAGYGEDSDNASVDGDFQRAADALDARLRLDCNAWRGETASVAAMPGRVISLKGFYDATSVADVPVFAKVTSSRLSVHLGDGDLENFRVTFGAMDFGDAAERRWVPSVPASPRIGSRRVFETFVCDRGGKWGEDAERDTIVVSPRSTPETPWVFLVANPNGDEGATMDVAMTMPLGGRRQGLYRFPRVGERVLVEDLGDRLVLAGYVPDRSTSPGDFPESGDGWTRGATALRYAPPTGVREPDGAYDEIGFAFRRDAAEALEARIVDGTAADFLFNVATAANDLKLRNSVASADRPRIDEAHRRYFAEPGHASADAVRALARELAEKYGLGDAPERALRLRTRGALVQTAEGGIEISTPGELRLNAARVFVNGMAAVTLQSEGRVQQSVGASSSTTNPSGIVLRSRRVVDAPGAYDSALIVDAADGVSSTGANVRMNGLFSARVGDALGASVDAANGRLGLAGATVDLATVARSNLTTAFENVGRTSGLDSISRTLEAWKRGSTPNGRPRPIADRGVGAFGLSVTPGDKANLLPCGNFRGAEAEVVSAGGDLERTERKTGEAAEDDSTPFRTFAGADPDLTVTQRELIRAKAFARQVDAQRRTAETVIGSAVDGKAASMTIHAHQLDLNVQVLKDLSSQHNSDTAGGAGS